MKIALVRGDFAAPSEFYNFQDLAEKNKIYLFTGKFPVWNLSSVKHIKIVKLFSPVDLNFGKISRWKMGILNRVFTDAHILFGLENHLKGFDIAQAAETYFNYTQQCINAKEKGYVQKVVVTVMENIAFNNEAISGRKEFKKRAFEKVDMFLAFTQKARDVLIEEGCDPRKIKVLKLGIDINKFRPGVKNKTNKIKLLFVGRLIKEKGVNEVIELFRDVQKQNPNIELIISGDGDLYSDINSRIQSGEIKSVKLLGKVSYDQMPEIYNSCDIFIHYPVGSKTWNEQYGMVLVESLSCGLPVIALDKGSIKEVIGDGGIVSSEKSFKSNLTKLVENRKHREELSMKARKYAELNYDARNYARDIERIYNKLIIEKN